MSIQNPTSPTQTSQILAIALRQSLGDDLSSDDLFPNGPKRLSFHDLMPVSPVHNLPPDFKMPPQIDCLSEHQNDQSIANLKVLLQSWGMQQLYNWFYGK